MGDSPTAPRAEEGGPAPAPVIQAGTVQIADGIHLIPDHRIPLVPNVGIIEGADSVLVVDTGMGPANGARVLESLQELTDRQRVLITLTHFHPEHGFGAQALHGAGTLLYNRAQATELGAKGWPYVEMFRGFGPAIAQQLDGVQLVEPDVVYDQRATVHLGGGVRVELTEWGPAHTLGDQVIFAPGERVLFTGDLVENRLLPIVPDGDVDLGRWVETLEALERLEPTIVVPGHGEPGGTELIAAVRDYLLDVRRCVDDLRREGVDADALTLALTSVISERYADWSGHEWITPAIRAFIAESD